MRQFFLTLCVFLISTGAHASAVVNLAQEPRVIEVEYGDGFKPQTIAPGAKFQLIGRMNVRYKGREVSIISPHLLRGPVPLTTRPRNKCGA